jgi:hypothetical protein
MAQRTDGPEEDVQPSEEKVRRAILGLLVSGGSQRPWSLGELEAEVEDASAVQDGVRQLQGLGLVHRCEDYIWPTRAALTADELLR